MVLYGEHLCAAAMDWESMRWYGKVWEAGFARRRPFDALTRQALYSVKPIARVCGETGIG